MFYVKCSKYAFKRGNSVVNIKIRALDVVVETEKKRSLNIATVLAVLIIVALFVLSGVLAVHVQQNGAIQSKNKQIASLQNQLATAQLVSIGFTIHRQPLRYKCAFPAYYRLCS